MRHDMGPFPDKVSKEAKGHRSKGARKLDKRKAGVLRGDTSGKTNVSYRSWGYEEYSQPLRPWQKGRSLLRPLLDARMRAYRV